MFASPWKLALTKQNFQRLPPTLQKMHQKSVYSQKPTFSPLRATGRITVRSRGLSGMFGRLMGLPRPTRDMTRPDVLHLRIAARERTKKPWGVEETWTRTISPSVGRPSSFSTKVFFDPDRNTLFEDCPIRFTPFWLRIGMNMITVPKDVPLATPLDGYQCTTRETALVLNRDSGWTVPIPTTLSPAAAATVIGTPLGQRFEIKFSVPLLGDVIQYTGEISQISFPDEEPPTAQFVETRNQNRGTHNSASQPQPNSQSSAILSKDAETANSSNQNNRDVNSTSLNNEPWEPKSPRKSPRSCYLDC